jgi:hypothetical protein|tara:strand:- start:7613 stop:7939 length:327 start_codon:yes stop_codon:yes gene_type:complete
MNTTNPNDDLFADFFQVGNYSNLSGNNNNNNNNKMQQLVVNGKKEKIKLDRQLKGGREDKEPKRLEKSEKSKQEYQNKLVENSKKRNKVKKLVGLAVVIGLIYLVTRK